MFNLLIITCLLGISFPTFSSDDIKKEIIDLINSNLSFYTKIEPGMGFAGEIFSNLVDENGNDLNCTIALRGKNIFINTSNKDYIYSYQEHWIDINIKEGNACNPDMYPREHRKFVTMDKKENPLAILELLENQVMSIKKSGEKKYVLSYTLIDDETNEEFKIIAEYDLNYPLIMTPNSNGFKHQYFNHKSIDLSSLSLCQENGENCSEEQDLSYLLKN